MCPEAKPATHWNWAGLDKMLPRQAKPWEFCKCVCTETDSTKLIFCLVSDLFKNFQNLQDSQILHKILSKMTIFSKFQQIFKTDQFFKILIIFSQ